MLMGAMASVCRLLFLLFTLICGCSFAQEEYNGYRGANQESIRCIGSTRSLRFPWVIFSLTGARIQFPRLASAQQFCAAPWGPYRRNHLSINGKCPSDSPFVPDAISERTRSIRFQPSTSYLLPQLKNRFQQMQIFCQYRCFSVRDVPNGQNKPKGVPYEARTTTESRRTSSTFDVDAWPDNSYRINLKEADTEELVETVKVEELQASSVTSLFLQLWEHGDRYALPYNSAVSQDQQLLSIDPDNVPVCDATGQFDYPVPSPYHMEDFENPSKMCNIALAGGNEAANAGAYCEPTLRAMGYRSLTWTLQFKESLTPRLEWTIRANSRFAIRLQNFCREKCRCIRRPRPSGTPNGPIPLQVMADDAVIFKGPGDVWHIGSPSDKKDGFAKTVTDPEWDEATKKEQAALVSTGECGDTLEEVQRFCPDPWPTSLLGPLPEDKSFDRKVAEARVKTEPGTCGNTCVSNRDCGAEGDGHLGCKCVAPTEAEVRAKGLDPVFPLAVCIAAAMIYDKGKRLSALGSNGRVGLADLLGKRDSKNHRSGDGEGVRGDVKDLICPCNATYVSHGCCASSDGMVWEDTGLKLGVMADPKGL